MTARLVVARIWFWQAGAARGAGWFVRNPWSLRPVIAQFFEGRAVHAEPADGVDRSDFPVRAGLDRHVVRDGKAPGLLGRALHHLFEEIAVAIDFRKLAERLVSEDMQSVEDRQGKLSFNQLLELRGYEPIRHPITPEFLATQARLKARIADIEARRRVGRESGAAA